MSVVHYLFHGLSVSGSVVGSSSILFWSEIINSFSDLSEIDNDDLIILNQLKQSAGSSWINFIPSDWQLLFGSLFDQFSSTISSSSSTTSSSSSHSPTTTTSSSLSQFDLLPSEIHKIEKDIYRTFSVFINDTKLNKISLKLIENHFCSSLRLLLHLLASHMGYTQGMNYIVALILLIESSIRNCYILLSYLMFSQHISLLFITNIKPINSSSFLTKYIKLYDQKFQLFYPILHFHLNENGFTCYCYTVDWFTTCFIRSSPGELSLHIMELLLHGFKDILIRIGLSIMHLLHDTLLKLEEDELHLNFRSLVKQLNAKEVIRRAILINLNKKKKPDVEENILQRFYESIQDKDLTKSSSSPAAAPAPSAVPSAPASTSESIVPTAPTTTTATTTEPSSTSSSSTSREYPPLPLYPPPIALSLPQPGAPIAIATAPTTTATAPTDPAEHDSPQHNSTMSQPLIDTILRIFHEKKTFLETVRERRKRRQERISKLFQRFHFGDHNTAHEAEEEREGTGRGGGAAAGMTTTTMAVSNDQPTYDRVDSPPYESKLRKSMRILSSIDPNNESLIQEEIHRMLNDEDMDDDEEEEDEQEEEEEEQESDDLGDSENGNYKSIDQKEDGIFHNSLSNEDGNMKQSSIDLISPVEATDDHLFTSSSPSNGGDEGNEHKSQQDPHSTEVPIPLTNKRNEPYSEMDDGPLTDLLL